MAKKNKGKGKSMVVQVEFDKMEEGGGYNVPDGKYPAKIASMEVKEGKEYPYINTKFEIVAGPYKGKNVYENFSLSPKALFKLRDLLVALGITVPKKMANLDLSQLVGKILGIEVEEEEYEHKGKKKKKPAISEFFVAKKEGKNWVIGALDDEELDDDEEEDDDDDEVEENDEDIDEDEEDDDETEDDEDEDDDNPYAEMTLKELKAECKERGIKVSKKDTEETLIAKLVENDEE